MVVVADHGVGFVPGLPKRLLRRQTLGHIAAVPLFVKLPMQKRGRVSDLPAQTVDVVPTIADVLNLSAIWPGMDGTSLYGGSISPHRRRTIEGRLLDPRGGEKFDLVFRKYSTFGFDRRTLDLFELAPGGREDLIGRRMPELSVAPVSSSTVVVADLGLYEKRDPRADFFPALLHGSVEGAPPRAVIAVTVNGRIAAVTRTYRDRGVTRFSCMLAPRFFNSPPNLIDFFQVVGGHAETLVPLAESMP